MGLTIIVNRASGDVASSTSYIRNSHTPLCSAFAGGQKDLAHMQLSFSRKHNWIPYPPPPHTDCRDDRDAEIVVRNAEIDVWMDLDLEAQAFIVKYLGAFEHTLVRNCTYAWEMWNALISFYDLQGEIELSNANAQLSAVIMCKMLSV